MIGEESKRHLEVFTIHPFKLSFFHSLDWNVRKKSKQSTTSDCVFCQQESCIHKRNWRDYLWRGQVWYFISYVEVSSCLSHCSLSFSTYAMFEMESLNRQTHQIQQKRKENEMKSSHMTSLFLHKQHQSVHCVIWTASIRADVIITCNNLCSAKHFAVKSIFFTRRESLFASP